MFYLRFNCKTYRQNKLLKQLLQFVFNYLYNLQVFNKITNLQNDHFGCIFSSIINHLYNISS
jgi:hypothetical protein